MSSIMSSSSSSSSSISLLLSAAFIFCTFFLPSADAQGGIVPGLSFNFYARSCPSFESIVSSELKKVFRRDIGVAAGLLRLHFHDCFVQGCEASVLLDGSASGPDEGDAPPNLTLRQSAFRAVENLRRLVHRRCGRVVSCSDILAAAARDSVVRSGGPHYALPYGRRDSLDFATREETLANLPPPSSTAGQLLDSLRNKNFTPTDVVALSGGHTIGISTCSSFVDRLYPNQDPTMDQTFARNLKRTCPTNTTNNTTVLDIRSPNVFDNKYYVDLMNRQGLFTSDQDLYTDRRTRGIVLSFAINQTLFFQEFAKSMIKMSQLEVLTGNQGEIRANCSARNSDNIDLISSVSDDGKAAWSAF